MPAESERGKRKAVPLKISWNSQHSWKSIHAILNQGCSWVFRSFYFEFVFKNRGTCVYKGFYPLYCVHVAFLSHRASEVCPWFHSPERAHPQKEVKVGEKNNGNIWHLPKPLDNRNHSPSVGHNGEKKQTTPSQQIRIVLPDTCLYLFNAAQRSGKSGLFALWHQ